MNSPSLSLTRSVGIPLKNAATTAGVAYILMLSTPFAEFYALPKIVVPDKIDETIHNLLTHKALFRYALVAYLVNFLGDIIAAWAVYILLKPVNEPLSLLAAWLRLIYTIVSLSSLLNLVQVLQIVNENRSGTVVEEQIAFCLSGFRSGWSFAYFFFGIYLLLMGWLVFRSGYIPKFVGVAVMLAGFGWLMNNLGPLLFPGVNINFGIVAILGMGELVFMLWLLIRGRRIPSILS